MDTESISRREFVRCSTIAAGAFTIVPRHVLGGAGFRAPSDTINIGCVGIGGKGAVDVRGVAAAEGTNIYALCDVDREHGAAIFNEFPEAKQYTDYREMLEQESDAIDAVTVTTPDHHHAVVSLRAMQMGKHVFCQKPLTRTLHENRRMREVARETGVTTQMGNQGHTYEGPRRVREWIDAGILGDIREVYVWTDRPIWPQALDRPTEAHNIPRTLHWNEWLGPASERPYHPAYAPFKWRGWWDFGTGALGDMGCHGMNAAYWALQLDEPAWIRAESTAVYEETAPLVSRVTYQYPETSERSAVKLHWLDGELLPPRPEEWPAGENWPFAANGQMYLADEGVIVAGIHADDPRIFPESLDREARRLEQTYVASPGVYKEWIQAVHGGEQANSDFKDHATGLTEMVLLGNLAVRTGEIIEWDSEQMRVTNVESPNKYVTASYRPGWQLP